MHALPRPNLGRSRVVPTEYFFARHPLRPGGPFEDAIKRLTGDRANLRVLDAGCGRKSLVKMPDTWRLVGMDVSRDALVRNKRLNARVVGDIQTYVWPRDSFDMILCWDVLEHLRLPIETLKTLLLALKRGGILVLGMPNLYSVKGLVTAMTPFVVHVWFYRYLLGSKEVQSRVFPTTLGSGIEPRQVRRFAMANRLDVPYFALYEGWVQRELRRRYVLADLTLTAIGAASRALSLGHLDLNLTDCIIILQKNIA